MHTRSYIQSRSGSRDGVALIAVLVFIVLLTILTVSYISFTGLNRLSTTSYSKSIQAQEVAQGGLEDILSDLHNEIIAGSIPDPGGVYTPASGGPTMYVPSTNLTAMPARIGYVASNYNVTNATPTQLSTTLIRVSRCTNNVGATFFTAPPSYYGNFSAVPGGAILDRASQASTTNADVSGRYISAARWNKTYLLATNSLSTVIPTPFATNAPDWVYVTRTGSRICTAAELTAGSLSSSSNLTKNYGATTPGVNPPASPVVGRYAFVMYDEGALLDATVAGSPSSLMNNSTVVATQSPPSLPIYTNSPSATPPILTSLAFTGKSYLSFADLTQLPGLSGTTGQTAVNNFINWRNAGGIANANSSYGNGYTGTGTSYLGAIFNYVPNGFLSFSSGDSPILGRQDLINYFAKIDPNINTTSATFSQALPYLGTFSRAVSAPSYYPPTDPAPSGTMPGIPGYTASLVTASPPPTYRTSMDNLTGVANRDLANVRYPASISAGTLITHYSDDTTTTTYSVNPGDPLLQNRFSLAKIGWLSSSDIGGTDAPGTTNPATGNGPSSAYATAIRACFGLTWGVVGPIANGGNPCWNYVGSLPGSGGTSQTVTGVIETLDQVALEAREPNFFEILKAAILSGSIGVNPGPAGWTNGQGGPFDFRNGEGPVTYGNSGGVESLDGWSFDRTSVGAIPAPSRMPDIQIIKIGADIIDQYDADSYPTAIYFHYPGLQSGSLNFDAASFTTRTASGGAGDLNGPSDMVYGEENLPYIQGASYTAGAEGGPTADSGKSPMGGWLQPELWNPHQEPVASNLSTVQQNTIPNSFQIRGYGSAWIDWMQNHGGPPGDPTPSGDTQSTALDGSIISLTDGNPTSSIFYPTPVMIATNLSTSNVSVSVTPGTGITSSNMEPTQMIGYSANPLAGFYLGQDPTYYYYQTDSADGNETECRMYTTSGVTLTLGWVGSGGSFHPYSYLPQVVGYSYCLDGQHDGGDDERGDVNYNGTSSAETHVYMDPRTFRFSDLEGWYWWNVNSTFYPSKGNLQSDNAGQGRPSSSAFVYPSFVPNVSLYTWESCWIANAIAPLTITGLTGLQAGKGSNTTPCYYADPDGVIRPGDSIWANASYGDGVMLFTGAGTPGAGTVAAGDTGSIQHGRRPVILNRPFRSLGELGYVFRDLPFKTLDFWTASSADAALLDVFSLTDESKIIAATNQINSVVAGQFNPNNAPISVIQAVLSGGSKKDLDPTYNLGNETASTPSVLAKLAAAIANNLNPITGSNPVNPILNRAALVTQIMPTIQNTTTLTHFPYTQTVNSPFTPNSPDVANKAYLESPVRALADVTNTRTWNLMIDIIAQSGQMSSAAKTLNDFVVQGERRYWLHVAIDRYTGKIVSQQLEPVYE